MDPYLEPYRRSAKRHGSGFGVTLWASPDTQIRRFEVFCQMYDLGSKRLLDAGCSRGDLAAYLLDRKIPFETYVGVDGLEGVIDFAQGRKLPRCQFICGDFISDPDMLKTGDPQVVCVSGTLNTMTDGLVLDTLDAGWAAASEALIFNFLSDRVGAAAPAQTEPARRFDTVGLLRWAFARSALVSFRQDYFPSGHDATILIRKERCSEIPAAEAQDA